MHQTQLRHILSVDEFSVPWLRALFALARILKEAHAHGVYSDRWALFSQLLQPAQMISFFYEESTRTRLSFEAAMRALGGTVTSTQDASRTSSIVKGESLTDSIRVIGAYGNVTVLRHPTIGAASTAASVSPIPIINAGDGAGEHPTQALLDLFTIWEHLAVDQETALTFVGDLKQGRTVHSLAKLVARLQRTDLSPITQLIFVSPAERALGTELRETLQQSGITIEFSGELNPDIVQRSSVLYMTRTQKEREPSQPAADEIILTPDLARRLASDACILHPLPRNAELPVEVDEFPQARYFEQAQNGLYVRMALLLYILRPELFTTLCRP